MTLKEIFFYRISPVYLIPFFLLLLYSIIIEPNWIELKHQEITNTNLSSILSDKKIVLISDLHIRNTGYREKQMIKIINDIKPDIIFITGEFTGRGRKFENYKIMVSNASKVLKQIRSKHGIYAVFGEGDLYSPSTREQILRESLKDAGVTVLSNETIDLEIDNKKLSLIGLGVTFAGIKNLFNNTRKPDHPSILLSHRPDFFMSGIDALEVNLADYTELGTNDWTWQDNAYWSSDSADVYFERDGKHTIRVLRREDGVAIDQILLTPHDSVAQYPPALSSEACYRKQDGDILINTSDIKQSNIYGSWNMDTDNKACDNSMLADLPDLHNKVEVPDISQKNYFETTFDARRGVKYHLWLRMKSNNASATSDSVYVQFSDSLNAAGMPRYQINRTLKDIYDVEVILSGDTHGGQVRFPYSIELINLLGAGIEYDQGLFDLRFTQLYVNRGIGWSNIPMRLFCRPEITQLHFVSE